jgi:hypothetical protein
MYLELSVHKAVRYAVPNYFLIFINYFNSLFFVHEYINIVVTLDLLMQSAGKFIQSILMSIYDSPARKF